MSGIGRGRGESSKSSDLEREERRRMRQAGRERSSPSSPGSGTGSGTGSSSTGPEAVRGRAGYRGELRTIPANIQEVRAQSSSDAKFKILTNFVALKIAKVDKYHQYRVSFEPNVESTVLRRKAFEKATEGTLDSKTVFDGMFDAYSTVEVKEKTLPTQLADGSSITVKIKHVAVSSSAPAELMRVYNIATKRLLRALEFFQVSTSGAFVHPAFSDQIGNNKDLLMLRGFRTTVDVHEHGRILVNMEPVHKIMQKNNVLEYMKLIRSRSSGNMEAIKSALIGKLVVTSYRRSVYRIEDVDFKQSPQSTFRDDKRQRDVKYSDYYRDTYKTELSEETQPLLLVQPNNRRKMAQQENRPLYLIPELCNMAGLTEEQRADNRLKMDLIRTSQVAPSDRVSHMTSFLNKLHACGPAKEICKQLGFSVDTEPVKMEARVLPVAGVGLGSDSKKDFKSWPKVGADGSFENLIMRSSVANVPEIKNVAVLITRIDANAEKAILNKLGEGFERIGLKVPPPKVVRIDSGDSAHVYVQNLRQLPPDTHVAIVVMHAQNKERYDAIKKFASCERGLITQVVTARLMTDQRKAGGASVKIGIQIAAKVGGAPWYIHLPLSDAMVCGYDTYHDTANRGRSFGAFVASTDPKFSRWYSKADAHDTLTELSEHMAENIAHSMKKWHEKNSVYPKRVIIYRDGVSEGQIRHVFETELKEVRRALKEVSPETRLTFIIVNKRIGARFYQLTGGRWLNCSSGMVIDDHVTRQNRYDFYLISQQTRQGTITPTYYNIIHDDSGLSPAQHQTMAHKMTLMYYNWAGPVRVPAPCQYAHKMALLCGEHLHARPNSILDDRLHFL